MKRDAARVSRNVHENESEPLYGGGDAEDERTRDSNSRDGTLRNQVHGRMTTHPGRKSVIP